MTNMKVVIIYIQYLVYCAGIPFVFLGSFLAYIHNFYFDDVSKFLFIIPIVILAPAWNYLLIKTEVLAHLFYLNGVDYEHIKFSEAKDNITA